MNRVRDIARRWTGGARMALAMLVVLLGAGVALAQSDGVSVEATIEQNSVVVGEPFSFTIAVKGTDDVAPPDMSVVPASFDVQELGRGVSSSVNAVNGHVVAVTTVELHYQMAVGAAGTYTIPSIAVRAGGKTLHTDPVRFEAGSAPKSNDFQVRISVDNTNPYVGQPVTITLTLYTTSNFSMPRIVEAGDFPRFDVADDPDWNGDRQQPFTFLGQSIAPVVGRGTLDGQSYATVSLACRLIPRESGPASLGPVTVSTRFMRTVRQGLFQTTEPGRAVGAQSNAIDIDVRPLPQAGRPAMFNGLVGVYQAHADADPTDVSVGDPITVHLLVRGGPLVDDVRLPDLESQPGFAGKLRISENQADRTYAQGGVVFTLNARALDDSVNAIPPIELAYFDPDTGTYGVTKTNPIPLRVRPTRRVTASDAVGAAPVSAGTTVQSDTVGIAHSYDTLDALRSEPVSVMAELSSPVWVTSIAAPPLAYAACAVGFAMKRRGARTGDARRRSRALPEAQAILRGAEGVDGVAAGIGTYFELAAGRPRASITPHDVESIVAPVAPDEAGRLRQILERCDAARFAGASVADVRELREEAQGLLRDIDPKLKRRRGA